MDLSQSTQPRTITYETRNLHLDSGELAHARVLVTPARPLEIDFSCTKGDEVVRLKDSMHIALARADTHVHCRQGYVPTLPEWEEDQYKPKAQGVVVPYDTLCAQIETANKGYTVFMASLAALKGGVWLMGTMGNLPYGPVGEHRWNEMQRFYADHSLVKVHVFPRMEPGVPPVKRQNGKDFASTFGGSGISRPARRGMFLLWSGGDVSYHNDQARDGLAIEEFMNRVHPPSYLLHHLYYDGETVLASQRETMALALETGIRSLLTRHVPTGPALDMLVFNTNLAKFESLELIAEVGREYLYFNRDMLESRPLTRDFNFRRPALPSKEDQQTLIVGTREQARRRNHNVFIGSDQAPHRLEAKRYQSNGLPGSPGTRLIEHTVPIDMHLVRKHGFTYGDVDFLSAISPADFMSRYQLFPSMPGSMCSGRMANLVIFDPEEPHEIEPWLLAEQLHDPNYHTAYAGEELFGKVHFTTVDGNIFDVRERIEPVSVQPEMLERFLDGTKHG